MAYATKYLFKWESVNGTTREIRVLLDGYSGSVIQRRLGRAPVLKKQHNGNVYGTSLEFYAECTVDGEFAEFYTTDPKAYRVDLYSGNTLLWQGYITPELYAEPDIAPPYDVQVIATDGVGELKLYDFAPQGLVSLRSMLTYLLGYTGLTTDVYLISSIKPGGSGAAGSLLEKTINLDYMAGKSCYEVLSYILDTLHATITWWKGAWILARETNVKFSSGKVQYFNTSGNAGTLAGSVVTLGKMYTNDAWPVGQLSSKIDPAKNSVRIQAPWHPVTALSNPDMTSDTGWTKAGGVVYDSTNKGYHLPEASLSAIPRISQTLSLSSLKNPMTLAAKVTGVSADLSLSTLFTAAMGFYVTYEVSGTTYHLERSDEGLAWKQGAMPSLLNYTNTIFTFLKTFDEDRTGAQTVDIEIPPFLLNNAFPAGTLAVYVFGGCVRVYGASLDVIISKGYQDNLYLDNDARGEGDEVEIAIGRETSAISPYQAFLQGILLDSGSLITSFKDDYITSSGLDFMAFIARDYARSFALPRIVQTGTVSLESSVTFPPLVFTKGALDYWLEGYSWNMLDDELDISARSLPTATITVDSETVTEAGGTASSSASQSSGSSSGGGFAPGGINYLETNASLETLVQLKPAYNYFGPRKGLIFDTVPEADVASSPAHLMLRNLGTAQEPNYALYTPFALITGGDQIVGSGTPGGGGGGGASYLYQLNDTISSWTGKPSVSATQVLVFDPSAQDKESSTGAWKYVPATDIGRVYQGGTGITIDPNTNEISLTSGVATTGTYRSVTVDTYGRVTAGTNPTTLSGYGITDAKFGTAGTDYVPITLGGTTKNVLTAHQSLSGYVPTSRTVNSKALSSNITLSLDDVADGSTRKLANYLPLAGGIMSGTITLSNNVDINAKSSDGTISYTIVQLNAYNNTILGASTGTTYIRSGATHLKHNKNGTEYNILDASNYDSYALPLTGGYLQSGTNYGRLRLVTDSDGESSYIQAFTSSSSAGKLYLTGGGASQGDLIYLKFSNAQINGNTIWHSGNSNKSDVAWACSTLTASSLANVGGLRISGNTVVGNGVGIEMWYNTSNDRGYIFSYKRGGSDAAYHELHLDGSVVALQSNSGLNVGIGTASPGEKLDVEGFVRVIEPTSKRFFSRMSTATVGFYNDSTKYTGAWNCRIACGKDMTDSGVIAGAYLNNGTVEHYWYGGAAESSAAMYIKPDGRVGIGTSSAQTGYRLTVSGAMVLAGTGAGDMLRITTPASYCAINLYPTSSYLWSIAADTNARFYWWNSRANGIVAQLSYDGTLTTTGDQVISSDINLKTHFKDITLTSEQIANAPSVSFDWKDGHGHSFGSIAQYWKPIVPEAVLGEEGSYTLAYGQLGTVLGINNGKAIFKLEQHETEQDKEIRKLREKVQKLEEDNLRLKARLGLEN